MPEPSLDLQLAWRGARGRIRVFDDHVVADTSFERDGLVRVPMDRVTAWRMEPCDDHAVCLAFTTDEGVFRVLLAPEDAPAAALSLRRVLGPEQPPED